ncbi:MAG TPA: asparagine synthase (glutamine-hydrolyzing) [Polyangia bacterium]|nr:asparagine synthase (glutamine-hydrolyzing) [Polyangia bacterium]
MCGIFGAIGDATDQALDAARAALRHRGPDSDGAWRDGAIGLAHTRLRIIDLSPAASQPMRGCDEQIQVTFNGEIYNHRALRRELESLGHRFRSNGDGEAIVHGYEEWGPAVVERLDGMFAFGLWDGRARSLLCARDRTGKKPLFYAVSPSGSALRFASEIKALVAAGHADALDRAQLPMFLSWGYVPAPYTLHAGVLQLPPACKLLFTPATQKLTVEEYWRPTFLEPPVRDSFAQAKARVRELVVAAVERRLESDVPLGAFLSGGIDSTIVVGVMAKLLGRRVRSFSIGFHGDPRFDETAYAREAAAALGSDHTELKLDPTSVESIERLVWLHDGPFADSSAIPTEAIARQMKPHVTVALSGDGGDELFAGYLRFLAAEAAERIPRSLRAALVRVGRAIPGGLPHHSLGARARRFLVAADQPLADRLARWNSSFAFELPNLLRPEIARGLDLDEPAAWQRRFFDGDGYGYGYGYGHGHGHRRDVTPLQKILEHNFRTYLAYDLQTKVDRCSAGSAFEVRAPFLDTALVEYAGRLPDGYKRRGPRTKHILREAFADLLPPRIARRGKMGFAVPLAAWFRSDLRDYLRDTLGPSARVHELVDARATAALVEEHLSTRADRSAQIWTLLTLEIWLRALASQSLPKAQDREARVYH